MRRAFAAALIVVAPFLAALDREPWLGEPFVGKAEATYTYAYFTQLHGATPPLRHAQIDQNLALNLPFVPWQYWEVELEAEVASTSHLNWGYRSLALQLRHQFLDDVIGDWISCSVGAFYRNVSSRMLEAVTTIYHGQQNFELNLSLGKEWAKGRFWIYRLFLFEGVGCATVGAPWSWTRLSGQRNFRDLVQVSLYLDGYFGFGSQEKVKRLHFHGYGPIAHRSLSAGLQLNWTPVLCSTFEIAYYRIFWARSFPGQLNAFQLRYLYRF